MNSAHLVDVVELRLFILPLSWLLRANSMQAEALFSAFKLSSQRLLFFSSSRVPRYLVRLMMLFYGCAFAWQMTRAQEPLAATTIIVGATSLLFAFQIVTDYFVIVFNPEEKHFLGWFPIDASSLLTAKLALFLKTLLGATFLLHIPSAVVFTAKYSVTAAALFLAGAMLGNILAAVSTLILYALVLDRIGSARLTNLIGYIQTLFFTLLILFSTFVLLPEFSRLAGGFSVLDSPWPWLPPFAPAALVDLALSGFDLRRLAQALTLPALIAGAVILLLRTFSQRFRDRLYETEAIPFRAAPRAGRLFTVITKAGFKERENWVMLTLTLLHLRDDWRLKAALVLFPIYFALWGVLLLGEEPVADPFAAVRASAGLLLPFMVLVLGQAPLSLQLLTRSLQYRASWIILLGDLDPLKILLAVRAAARRLFLQPYLMATAFILLYQIGNRGHVLLIMLLFWAAGEFFLSFMHQFMITLPFSRPHEEVPTGTGNLLLLMVLTFGLAGLLSGVVFFYAFRSYAACATALLLIFVLFLLSEAVFRRRAGDRLNHVEFPY
ncbi:MAG: hypothetical protein HY645_13160 [Acidobacteria bacterium]|nr:hypothetical protein [Acidobacteriota bacterium]